MKIIGKLVIHPTLKVLGYFKENGEFVQVVDKTEGGELNGKEGRKTDG